MLEVNYEEKENIKVVRFIGELEINVIEKLKEEFEAHNEGFKYFLFDLGKLEMIDSSGLGYVVSCLKHLRSLDGELKIIGLSNQVKLIFEITRVDSIIDIEKSEDDAINNFIKMEKDYESNNTDTIEITA